MDLLRKIKKSMVVTDNKSESGIYCLKIISNYYNGYSSIERFRVLSGSNATDCNLLGLSQAAQQSGFNAKGYKLNIEALNNLKSPCILATQQKDGQQRYICFMGIKKGKDSISYMIADPLDGFYYLDVAELTDVWPSAVALLIEPNEQFGNVTKRHNSRSFFKYVTNNNRLLFISLILSSLLGLLWIGGLTCLFSFFERINSGINISLITIVVGKLVCIYLIFILLDLFANKFGIIHSISISKRIIFDYFSLTEKLNKSYFDNFKKSNINPCATEIININLRVSEFFTIGLKYFILAISFIIFSTFWHWSYFLVIFFMTLPIVMAYKLSSNKLLEKNRFYQRATSNNSLLIDVLLSKFYGLSSFLRQGVISQTLGYAALAVNYKQFEYQKRLFNLNFLIKFLLVALVFIIVCMMNLSPFYNTIPISQISEVAMLVVVSIIFSIKLIHILLNIQQLNDTIEHINELQFIINHCEVEKETIDEIFKIEAISLEYCAIGKNKPNFSNLNFEIKKGGVYGFLELNGESQALLSSILQNYNHNYKGQLLINNCLSLLNISPTSWADKVAYVPSNPSMTSGTIIQNISFDDSIINPTKIQDFAREFQLNDFFSNLSVGGFTALAENSNELLVVEKQLVALYKAIYINPELLIIEEPLFFLYPTYNQIFTTILEKIKLSTVTIILTSNTSLVKLYCSEFINTKNI